MDLGYEQKACNKLKNDSRDDEFLVSRIIFLTTYGTKIDIEKLIDQYHLAENICLNISRHAKQFVTKQKKVRELDPMEDMALIETLKLMFNITHFCPQRATAFSPALQSMIILITKRAISSSKPLEPPIGSIVNSLLNIDFENKDNKAILYPKATPNITVDRLIEILDKSIRGYKDEELEQNVSPLLTLLRKVYEIAPKDVQVHTQRALLPSEEDRKQILGRGTTLPSRLLRLSSNPTTPQVRESISSLLFELSDKDAKTFVQNVGYGFAAGFLFQHKISVPENALEAWSTSDSDSTHARASQDSKQDLLGRINPITGQFIDHEAEVEMPDMTDEEKEREAEKLFVLFERYAAANYDCVARLTFLLDSRRQGLWTLRTRLKQPSMKDVSSNLKTMQNPNDSSTSCSTAWHLALRGQNVGGGIQHHEHSGAAFHGVWIGKRWSLYPGQRSPEGGYFKWIFHATNCAKLLFNLCALYYCVSKCRYDGHWSAIQFSLAQRRLSSLLIITLAKTRYSFALPISTSVQVSPFPPFPSTLFSFLLISSMQELRSYTEAQNNLYLRSPLTCLILPFLPTSNTSRSWTTFSGSTISRTAPQQITTPQVRTPLTLRINR